MHHTSDILLCTYDDIWVQSGRRHSGPLLGSQAAIDLQTRPDKANHGVSGCCHVDLGLGDSHCT